MGKLHKVSWWVKREDFLLWLALLQGNIEKQKLQIIRNLEKKELSKDIYTRLQEFLS